MRHITGNSRQQATLLPDTLDDYVDEDHPVRVSAPRDLKDKKCKDIMILSGEDREIAIALAHGYRLGKKNTTQYVPEVLGEATDNFMDYCLDHPGDNALDVREVHQISQEYHMMTAGLRIQTTSRGFTDT